MIALVPLRFTFGTFTYWLVPLVETASPILPATQLTPLTRVAVLPLPEESAEVVPDPSLNGPITGPGPKSAQP